MKRLWTKKSSFYLIEIHVGKTWVEAARMQSGEDEAKAEAARQLRDPAVDAVRVTLTETQTTCNLVMEQKGKEAPAVFSRKWRVLTETGKCFSCRGETVMALDRQDQQWSICKPCDRTLPV